MTIHKSIFKELIINLSVILFSLSIILFMEKFVRITRLFMGRGADISDIFKIFIYLQPSILLLALPMAMLISIFLVYGRMATDSETVVLKSCGMSFTGIAGPALVLSIVCFGILLSLSLYLMPRSMAEFRHTLHKTIVKKASMTFEAGTFSDVFKGTVIFVKDIPSKDDFRGVFIYREPEKPLDRPLVIVAEGGSVSSNPAEGLIRLSMRNGLIHTYNEETSSALMFDRYDFVLTSGIDDDRKIRAEEVKTLDLWRARNSRISWEVELYRRFALPFACLIFGMLGPSLTNRTGRIGRIGGFAVSMVILVLYYTLLVMGEGMAKSGKLPAMAGVWMPDIVFGALAVTMYILAMKDRPLRRT
jgi:lipopolysaccharide export system permease protein